MNVQVIRVLQQQRDLPTILSDDNPVTNPPSAFTPQHAQ
jgi:hypothetical protein